MAEKQYMSFSWGPHLVASIVSDELYGCTQMTYNKAKHCRFSRTHFVRPCSRR